MAIKGTEEQGVFQEMSEIPHIGQLLKDFPVESDVEYFYKTSHMVRLVYFRTKVNDDDINGYFESKYILGDSPPPEYSVEQFSQKHCFPIYPSENDVVYCFDSDCRIYFYYMPSRAELTGYSIINLRD